MQNELRKMYFNGWPSYWTNVSEDIRAYFKIRADIYVEGDLVFLEERIIVPVGMRTECFAKAS